MSGLMGKADINQPLPANLALCLRGLAEPVQQRHSGEDHGDGADLERRDRGGAAVALGLGQDAKSAFDPKRTSSLVG
jgi:hypothetical protein